MRPITYLWGFAATALLTLLNPVDASESQCAADLISEELSTLIEPDSLLKHLEVIQGFADRGNGSRLAGSLGHRLTIGYIQDYLRSLGYYVETQPVGSEVQVHSTATLDVKGENISMDAMAWSPDYTANNIPVVLVNASGCDVVDYSMGLDGGIALVTSGEYGDKENTLLVGTHTDSVNSSAGINDNASGIASLLEVATRLSKFRTKSTVKFAFWTASEPCQLGSKYWLDSIYPEELDQVKLYLDVNMVGSPNGALKVYRGGDKKDNRVGNVLEDGFQAQGISPMIAEISKRSDYTPFLEARVPFNGLFSGADGYKSKEEADRFGGQADEPYDPNYHGVGDNLQNINATTLLMNTKALAHAVGVYGNSSDVKPRRGDGSRYAGSIKHACFMSLASIIWLLSNTP
ncbi:hypothetical protein GGR52DRAFT_587742 [Hypoxylon sp. FL1284]|nr:hypothetical protein GGR52DRAFT_587742 [Hypoxylon sp. FL1284]